MAKQPPIAKDPGAELANSPNVIVYVENLFVDAVKQGASEINLTPTEAEMVVQYKVDGVLHEPNVPPEGLGGAIVDRIKIMAGMDTEEKSLPQNGMICVNIQSMDKDVDMRVSCTPSNWGPAVVIHLTELGLA